jgi:hypothetical protein
VKKKIIIVEDFFFCKSSQVVEIELKVVDLPSAYGFVFLLVDLCC